MQAVGKWKTEDSGWLVAVDF